MTITEAIEGGHESHVPAKPVERLTHADPRIADVYQIRRDYAAKKGWNKAVDPDVYDLEYDTSTLAVPASEGGYRASLRLTRLHNIAQGGDFHECLSLQMLGRDTPLRQSAEHGLVKVFETNHYNAVYDMTRFVVDESKYNGSLRERIEAITEDFMLLIGGAVDATDDEALATDSALWVFTTDTQLRRLLERHGICPSVLADSCNDEGVKLQFCTINPSLSLRSIDRESVEVEQSAAQLIKMGREVVSLQ